MGERKIEHQLGKLFAVPTLLLCIVGLVLNMVLAKLIIALGIPLYIDNVGSVLVAALGGPIPGMAVGFLSNLVNSISNPISMYYAILTVFNALAASYLSQKGYLRSVKGCLLLAVMMMFIGGACGSVMTWMLYGGGIGGIAAPLATRILSFGVPEFWSQFLADMVVDIPDKLITVTPVYLFLHFYPAKLYDVFPNSYIYDRSEKKVIDQSDSLVSRKEDNEKFHSVNIRIAAIIVISSVVLSGLAVLVSMGYYQEELRDEYRRHTENAAKLIAAQVDGDRVESFIELGEQAYGYVETKNQLESIRQNLDEVMYVYVYQVNEAGYKVVFDLDTEDMAGDSPGMELPFDESAIAYKDQFDRGEDVDPFFTHDSYGRLLTACVPIKNSAGETVAYGCADTSMEVYVHNMLVFFIKVLSMLFGTALFLSSFALWYASGRITRPINKIVELTRKFNETNPKEWLSSPAWVNRTEIHTGDEIEELYQTVCSVQENIAENVTKLMETEQKLRESYELEKQNKKLTQMVRQADAENAMKTEFYSRMSHDMRTPMNGIMGLVNLSREEQSPEVLKENIQKIGMSSQYLLALINDTLDMSKIESKKMQLEKAPVCLETLVGDIKDMVEQTVRKKEIHFQEEYNITNWKQYLLMDEVRVKQIFMNLFSNAIKFTAKGGSISLTVNCRKTSENLNHYQIILRDTGCGMSEDFIKNRLFHPFEQEKNNITITSAGSGLGLSIVKNLVEMMDGTIAVESELDEGTSFILDFDFERVHAPEAACQKDTTDFGVLKGKRILLCEDHPLNAEIVTRLLAKVGTEVERAEDGQQGVQMFEHSQEGYYQAILMDVRMPVMTGIQAAGKIRSLRRPDAGTIPIIAMTANAYAEDKKMTRDAGMNAHLSKPIEPTLLFTTLTQFLG